MTTNNSNNNEPQGQGGEAGVGGQAFKRWYRSDAVWGAESMVYADSNDPHIGKFICDCDPMDDWSDADDDVIQTAQQIAGDHNRIPELEQQLAKAQQGADGLREALEEEHILRLEAGQQLATAQARVAELTGALDRAAYTLFQVKRMGVPDYVIDHVRTAYDAAMAVLEPEATTATQPAPAASASQEGEGV